MNFDQTKIGFNCHFLDSGAFSLLPRSEEFAKRTGRPTADFHKTKAAKKYLDDYAAFVKKYEIAIDLYANVDVIGDPELTWRNQQYLENEHGLSPVPVVHYKTDLRWLRHYRRRDYLVIALGGLVRASRGEAYFGWLDRAFEIVCNTPDRMPSVRLHGFGLTGARIMWRYPWWSVDSSAWVRRGGFGVIWIPKRVNGEFDFREEPYNFFVSWDSPTHRQGTQHYNYLSLSEKQIIHDWLDLIGVPWGENTPDGKVKKLGVMNNHSPRKAANLLYFDRLQKAIPKYPWPFPKSKKGFGLLK